MRANSPEVITIDGPVAAGKTTAANSLAERLGFALLDTGAIYRCVALAALDTGQDWQDEPAMAEIAQGLCIDFQMVSKRNRIALFDTDVTEEIRRPEISNGASIVSAHPAVRTALLEVQRRYAENESVIAEGRDTGTVVFPGADLKVFLTAAPETRAERRFRELRLKGLETTLDLVLAELQHRDLRDTSRPVAPLVPAADAVTIDSTLQGVEAVVRQIERLYRQEMSS